MVQRRVPGCSYVNAHMFKVQTISTIHDKNTTAFFTKETFFDVPKKTPQTRAKSNIVTHFAVRNGEKVARRINATTL